MEKTEAPSESKLAELRLEGIVPFSPLSTGCVASLVFLVVLYAQGGKIPGLFAVYRKILQDDAPLFPVSLRMVAIFSDMLSDVLMLIATPAAAAVAATLLWGMIQTKFLFRFRAIAFDVSRINPFRLASLSSLSRTFFKALAITVLALGIGVAVALLGMGDVLRLLNHHAKYSGEWAPRFATAFMTMCGLLLTLLALAAWFTHRLLFMYRHRMTREELKQSHEDSAG